MILSELILWFFSVQGQRPAPVRSMAQPDALVDTAF
jgi:hypothetical protein